MPLYGYFNTEKNPCQLRRIQKEIPWLKSAGGYALFTEYASFFRAEARTILSLLHLTNRRGKENLHRLFANETKRVPNTRNKKHYENIQKEARLKL